MKNCAGGEIECESRGHLSAIDYASGARARTARGLQTRAGARKEGRAPFRLARTLVRPEGVAMFVLNRAFGASLWLAGAALAPTACGGQGPGGTATRGGSGSVAAAGASGQSTAGSGSSSGSGASAGGWPSSGGSGGSGAIASDSGPSSEGGEAGPPIGCPDAGTHMNSGTACSAGQNCLSADVLWNAPGATLTCDCVGGLWTCHWLTCPVMCEASQICPAGQLPAGCSCTSTPPQMQNVGGCCCSQR
jgi:hypothetical protein